MSGIQDGLLAVLLCHEDMIPSWGIMHSKGKWVRQKSTGEVFLTYEDKRLDISFNTVWQVIRKFVKGKALDEEGGFNPKELEKLEKDFGSLLVKLPHVRHLGSP